MNLYNILLKLRPFLTLLLFVVLIGRISADGNTVGLILIDENQSYNGYALFAPYLAKTTYLIDNYGYLVHQWESGFKPGASAYLLENGNLLRSAKINDPTGTSERKGGFELFDWGNNLVWRFYYDTQHHDIEPIPNENVLMVVNDPQSKNATIQAGRDPNLIDGNNIRSLSIVEVKQTDLNSGEIVWQWNAWDHLVQDFDSTKDNFGVVADHPELIDINFVRDGSPDWLHTNSVAYNEELDQIVVSNRSTNEIWIIDHSTTTEQAASHEGGNSGIGGDLIYRWGNPIAYDAGTEIDQRLFAQHDAHWVTSGLRGEGNILIFNNGLDRPEGSYSSIVEIIPPLEDNWNYGLINGLAFEPTAPIWDYKTVVPEDFFSPRYGGSQRLPNGNTLICNSHSGEFFEVSQNDEIIWKYINPVVGNVILEQGTTNIDNNHVFRCYKYSPDYPAFIDRDLSPGGQIERNPNVEINDGYSLVTKFKLFDNYPNPFNPTTTIHYILPKESLVTITIYDVLGKEINQITSQKQLAGNHSIQWNGKYIDGNPVSAGIYLYQIQAGDFMQTKKMLLMK